MMRVFQRVLTKQRSLFQVFLSPTTTLSSSRSFPKCRFAFSTANSISVVEEPDEEEDGMTMLDKAINPHQPQDDDLHHPFHPGVEIQKTLDGRGWGVFAKKDFPVGDLVVSSQALKTTTLQDKHSIQLDWNQHVTVDLPARFFNHVCGQASVGIRPNDKGAYDFIAIAPISKGQEVLWDYECSEYVIEDFDCSCGSPACRLKLKGFRHHGPLVLKAYGREYIAPYLFTPKSVCRNPFHSNN